MTRRCDQCRYWTPPSTNEDGVECVYAAVQFQGQACRRVLHINAWAADLSTTAIVADADCYGATMITKAEHSCSMWETKE